MLLSFLGPPCSGKGTHTRILQTQYDFKVLGAGDILRVAAQEDESIATLVREGKLVPVETIWGLMEQKLEEIFAENTNANVLFDGFPREIAQAKAVTEYLSRRNIAMSVVNFVVSDHLLLERMSKRLMCNSCGYTTSFSQDKCPECGGEFIKRSDDNPDTLQDRIDVYNTNLQALKEFCIQYYDWYDMDGEGTIDDVQTRIHKYIAEQKLLL